jgi:hypothetical protein
MKGIFRRSTRSLSIAALAVLLQASSAFAVSFTPGNVVVVKVGNGTTALSASAAPVYLCEYTTAGSLVQTIALPTTATLPSRKFTLGGTNTAEGFLSQSGNTRFLTLGGYDAAVGTANVAGTTVASSARVIARVDYTGAINTTTAITDGYSTGRIAGVTSDDGTRFWSTGSGSVAGLLGGMRYSPAVGSTTSVLLTGTPPNLRVPVIYGGQVYTSASYLSPNYLGVAKVGTGLPTTTGQATTTLTGFPTSGTHSNFGYFFKDASTLFVVDDGTAATGGGLQKWTLSGGTWTQAGSPFPYIASAGTPGLRGLTGTVSGSTVTLYGTTAEASGNNTLADALADTVSQSPR